ncbi:hypothetical protein BCR44DRAFT_1443486 [Catenaria anguillulae PL171]|uniref:Uncharacterized protein n=1 Tax=Catenaria anguillulae PL171 TaxID=765915 RepID=A0A1Y2H8T1_9FUNG|nr:hypothetical protein BCR44DRAFT_1443486 [Catenaria anguillulae PL171]
MRSYSARQYFLRVLARLEGLVEIGASNGKSLLKNSSRVHESFSQTIGAGVEANPATADSRWNLTIPAEQSEFRHAGLVNWWSAMMTSSESEATWLCAVCAANVAPRPENEL